MSPVAEAAGATPPRVTPPLSSARCSSATVLTTCEIDADESFLHVHWVAVPREMRTAPQ
jgi:hypothetical protein